MSQELRKAYEFSINGTVAKISLVMAILSTVRFFVDIYDLPLTALLSNILKTYRVVFHTCFDVLFIWLPIKPPPWVKDLFIFYSLLAFVVLKIMLRQATMNYRHPWIVMHNYNGSKRKYWFVNSLKLAVATVAWPLKISGLFKSPHLVIGAGAHGPSALYFSTERPREGVWRGAYLGDARLMMAVRLFATVAGASIVLLFNYAFSI